MTLTMRKSTTPSQLIAIEERAERAKECARLYARHRTLQATGQEMGLTKERVRQLLAEGHRRGWIAMPGRSRARRAVRKQLEVYGLAGYLAKHPQCTTLGGLAKALRTTEETLARILTKSELRLITQAFAARAQDPNS